MKQLMRCLYCGLLQDEPARVKQCARCGGELVFEEKLVPASNTYLQVQMELDQVAAPAGENVDRYLLFTLHAPDKVPPEEAAPAGKKRPPLNFTAVLDVSGSMYGEKIEQAKEAVRQAASCLHPSDIFSLVTFASRVNCAREPVHVSKPIAASIDSLLKEIGAGGMTALHGGLELGIQKASESQKENNLILLLSDGQANVGETDLEVIGQMTAQARQRGLLVSTLGVGLDYNEALMVEIANQGGGRFYHIESAHQIPRVLMGELGEVAMLAARDVKLHLALPVGATLVPLSNSYPVQQTGQEALVTLGDIPCGVRLEVGLRLALLAQSSGARLGMDGRMTFRTPAGHEMEHPLNRVTVRFVQPDDFPLRAGLVSEVAERVFTQLRANSVLGVARLRAVKPAEVEQHTQKVLADLHAYAELLGEERAEKAFAEASEQIHALSSSSSAVSKHAVSYAHRTVRSLKNFLDSD